MEVQVILAAFTVGLLLGMAILYYFLQKESVRRTSAEEKARLLPGCQEELNQKTMENRHLFETNSDLRADLASSKTALEQMRIYTDARIKELSESHVFLSNSFSAISAQALKQNNESFMDFAKATFEKWQSASHEDLLKKQVEIKSITEPLKESLEKVDGKIRELEVSREGAYRSLHQQIHSMIESQNQLRTETENLSRILHAPAARGRWGEIQLRRVVELAGMLAHCDFEEQVTAATDEKQGIRPDLVVRLPGNKCIVVDAKVPLGAYLQAIECKDEERRQALLLEHAEQVKRHINQLAKKSYWQHFNPTPEFVVLFLPGEIFFSAALASKPELIEWGVEQGIIIATPTTLIALLRAVAYGWRNETLADNALKISQLARQLCERIEKVSDHFNKLGRNLKSSVDAYNQTLGSLETRVFSTARKLNDLGAHASLEVKMLEPIEKVPRTFIVATLPNDEVEN